MKIYDNIGYISPMYSGNIHHANSASLYHPVQIVHDLLQPSLTMGHHCFGVSISHHSVDTPLTLMPSEQLLASLTKLHDRHCTNTRDRQHPSLTPLPISNYPPTPTLLKAVCSRYKLLLIIFLSLQSTPMYLQYTHKFDRVKSYQKFSHVVKKAI